MKLFQFLEVLDGSENITIKKHNGGRVFQGLKFEVPQTQGAAQAEVYGVYTVDGKIVIEI